MTHAYSELYLDDAMNNMGDMVEYALCTLGYKPDNFWGLFITSGIADKFGKGNPKYVAGMSGYELAEAVFCEANILDGREESPYITEKGREYWAGWIMAYYQWETGKRFEDMARYGMSLSTVLSMYILHEADVTKFVKTADEIIARNKLSQKSRLQFIRKARGFTQRQLSEASGVSVRMIQLYEQRQNDIAKAQATVVIRLARALGCKAEDLVE